MTYATFESSRYGGQPVDLYRFQVGVDEGYPATPSAPGALVAVVPSWTEFAAGTSPGLSCPPAPGSSKVCAITPNSFEVWGSYSGIISGTGYFYRRATFSSADGIQASHQYLVRVLEKGFSNFQPHGSRVQIGGVDVAGPYSSDTAFAYHDFTVTTDGGATFDVDIGHFVMNAAYSNVVYFAGLWIYDLAADADANTPGGRPFRVLNCTSDGLSHTFRGEPYEPAIITCSEITSGGGESADGEFDLTMPRDHALALLVRDGLPVAPITLTHYRVHRPDIAAGISYVTPFVGQAVRGRFRGAQCVLTFATPRSLLDRKKPSVLCQQHCNWGLYDARCKVDRNTRSFVSTITAIETNTVTIDGLAAESGADSTKFQFGSILMPSGEYAFIENQGGDVVTLLNTPRSMAVGDVVTVYQGCDRSVTVCDTRHNNLENFGGRPTMKSKNIFGPTGLEL